MAHAKMQEVFPKGPAGLEENTRKKKGREREKEKQRETHFNIY